MDYNYIDNITEKDNFSLPESGKINKFLLKNNEQEILKGIDFLASNEVLMYIHGFIGTGKRQYINYVSDFKNKDVILLEYYCKASTVCDDILLSFINTVEKNTLSNAVNANAKITTLGVKLIQYISSIKKPFLLILHSLDDIEDNNLKPIITFLEQVTQNTNIKIIASTRAMTPDLFGNIKVDRKVFLKGLTKENFKEFITSKKIECTDTVIDDFYKYTRGYYYYTALALKIVEAMKISLGEFLTKFAQSEMTFDSYLGLTYINLIPKTIQNFFWFLRTIRHGLTLNALAVFELYDEFSLNYLKSNLMIFQVDETVFVQDYFLQNIDISIPAKTEIKLHKYIINIYEKLLKEPLQTREITISRQALRSEIEYHNKCIHNVENSAPTKPESNNIKLPEKVEEKNISNNTPTLDDKFVSALKLAEEKKNTEAIEAFLAIINSEDIDTQTLTAARLQIARLYKEVNDYSKAQHYYEINELYYKKNNEVINLNYLYYELTDLYFKMYKNERAVETIKKVIYSVDTPQSLMVSACTLLGNIYSSINNYDEAYQYYQKALESLEENTSENVLSELFFKYALANDDRNDEKKAFEYYSKCITLPSESPYKALAYSNMASCYFDNDNYSDALDCFLKAYNLDKSSNNYDGVYYNASHIAKIYVHNKDSKALDYLIEAKQSAEFINESSYILEASINLGDYYYNDKNMSKNALIEYFKARKIVVSLGETFDISKIDIRIKDMKLRMDEQEFTELEKKYG